MFPFPATQSVSIIINSSSHDYISQFIYSWVPCFISVILNSSIGGTGDIGPQFWSSDASHFTCSILSLSDLNSIEDSSSRLYSLFLRETWSICFSRFCSLWSCLLSLRFLSFHFYLPPDMCLPRIPFFSLYMMLWLFWFLVCFKEGNWSRSLVRALLESCSRLFELTVQYSL